MQSLKNHTLPISTDGSSHNNSSAYSIVTYDATTKLKHTFGHKYPDMYDKQASLYSELFGILASIHFLKHIEDHTQDTETTPTQVATKSYIYSDNEEAILRAQDHQRIKHYYKL